jgi:hypothetical protein
MPADKLKAAKDAFAFAPSHGGKRDSEREEGEAANAPPNEAFLPRCYGNREAMTRRGQSLCRRQQRSPSPFSLPFSPILLQGLSTPIKACVILVIPRLAWLCCV